MMIHPSVVNTHLENYEETVLGDQKTIKMRAIAPGNYAMGSMGEGFQNKGVQSPQHEVYVDAFWMSEKEISWEIYQEFLYRENLRHFCSLKNQQNSLECLCVAVKF